MFASRIAFVDLETTGTSPAGARITEVGVVLVETEGSERRVSEWASLVNPGCRIPPEIVRLTGISDAMVAGAPRFEQIAGELAERLAGAVFVAHNARFDYGFLRAEFARVGIDFAARTLCTVRLSRALFPDRESHSLDAIVARFGLATDARHRALADARLTLAFVDRVYARLPRTRVEAAIERLIKQPALPPKLAPEAIAALPHAPGVYLMYGMNAAPIYIGKSKDLRARVMAHFSADLSKASEARLAQEVERIEWEETAGEFGALLREAELVRSREPLHNRRLRRNDAPCVVALTPEGRLQFASAAEVPAPELPAWHGPFASRSVARSMIAKRVREEGLCETTLGLARAPAGANTPCFARQLQRCRGACVGEESLAEHARRAAAAFAAWRIPAWPHVGAIALVERDPARLMEAWHVFDAWCHLGTVANLDAALELARKAPRRFDAEVLRLLRSAHASPAWALETVAL